MTEKKENIIYMFCCSSGGYCSEVANNAAFQAARNKLAYKCCLTAVAAGLSFKIDNFKKADKIIVIDGCGMGCARTVIEKADIKIDDHIVVLGAGNRKHNEDIKFDEIYGIIESTIGKYRMEEV